MKKYFLINIIWITLVAIMLAGCGKKKNYTNTEVKCPEAEIETIEEIADIESLAPEEPTEEEMQLSSHLLFIKSASGNGSYEAYDSQGAEYSISLADTFPDEQKANLYDMAVVEVTAYNEMEEKVSDNMQLIIESATVAKDSPETEELERNAFEWIYGFSVDHSVTGNLYAKQEVNVRKGPSTDYEKLGGLSTAEEVMVTGKADNGWYQILFNNEVGYVSDQYIVTEKPIISAASPSEESPTASNETVEVDGYGGEDFYSVYSEAEMDAMLNSGDLEAFFQMLNSNAAVTFQDGGEIQTSESSVPVATEKKISLSTEFVDYLNEKRIEQGLEALSWSESMGATALERAEEIVGDFSHSGSRNCSSENIAMTSKSSVSNWYESFYGSTVHRYTMLDSSYKSAAAAVCQVGSTYYVAVLFGY